MTEGWLYNPNPAARRDIPDDENNGGRVTLKYDSPNDDLRVNFQKSIDQDMTHYWVGDTNETLCQPRDNIPIYSTYNQCGIGAEVRGDLPHCLTAGELRFYNGAAFTTGNPVPIFGKGPHTNTKDKLEVLNANMTLR